MSSLTRSETAHFLEQHDIFVSSGSACSKGAKSVVLKAYGLPEGRVKSALRLSFCKDTTKEQLDVFLDTLEQGIRRFKAVIR